MLLLGNFQHTLDDKNRIRLPAKYREKLGNDYILMPGIDGCIFLYPAAAEEKFLRAVEEMEFDSEKSDIIDIISEMSATVEADSQGRFMLTDDLLKFANIDKEVRIVGSFKWIEIWSEELYLKRKAKKDRTPETINAAFKEFHKSVNNK
ncbi:MAG: cell division/cell wall cluster transcriptional repressor MraZ [Clostridiales bacterium]|nr:cell division/cell wall cluster transcriptional repressor MraZ [Clostridiales bacterium]